MPLIVRGMTLIVRGMTLIVRGMTPAATVRMPGISENGIRWDCRV